MKDWGNGEVIPRDDVSRMGGVKGDALEVLNLLLINPSVVSLSLSVASACSESLKLPVEGE